MGIGSGAAYAGAATLMGAFIVFMLLLFLPKLIFFVITARGAYIYYGNYRKTPSKENLAALAVVAILTVFSTWLIVAEISPILNFPALIFPKLCNAQPIIFPLQAILTSKSTTAMCFENAAALHKNPFGCSHLDYFEGRDEWRACIEGAISSGFQDCGAIEDNDASAECFSLVALKSGDAEFCERIANPTSQYTLQETRLSCIQELLIQNGSASCGSLRNQTYQRFCQAYKRLCEESEGTPSCGTYFNLRTDPEEMTYCVAAVNKDYSFCDLWGSAKPDPYQEFDAEDCKIFVSVFNGDIGGCEAYNESAPSCMFSLLKKKFFACPSDNDLIGDYEWGERLDCSYPGNISNLEGACNNLSNPDNAALCQKISQFVVSNCSAYDEWDRILYDGDEERPKSEAALNCTGYSHECPCEYYLCNQWKGHGGFHKDCNLTISSYIE